MGKFYLYFIVIAGMFGAMLGRCSPPDSTANFERQVELAESRYPRGDSQSSESSSSSSSSSDAVELRRESNGHFFADVEINGAQVRVLVDTGASGIALSRDDARRAGIAVSAGMYEVVGKGANGDVHGEVVTLERVALGPKKAENVSAVVLDNGDQSLLGQSFLSQFASVEIKGDTMFLR